MKRDLTIRHDIAALMTSVDKAINVAKIKLGTSGWIRRKTDSEFRELLAKLLKPIKDNWQDIRAGTSIRCG